MKKLVPYAKLSGKERKRLNALGRGSWNGVDPVTRVAETNKKRYTRKLKHKSPFPVTCD